MLEQLLARRKPAGEITLGEIEGLVIEARQEIEKWLTQILVEANTEEQAVPGPTCPECGK